MALTRRRFLRRGATGGAAVAVASTPLAALFTARRAAAQDGAYGPLVPDPARILNLPAGFRYTVIQRRGDVMSDGVSVPGLPDGMAAFAGGPGDPPGSIVLMRNHEIRPGTEPESAFFGGAPSPAQEALMPDAAAGGGVSRVVIDGSTFEPLSSNTVLAGTFSNCAGGPSPWGWLTCEESTSVVRAAAENPSAPEDWHGFVYLCRADAGEQVAPERIAAYGRFNHEAVAIDATTNAAYLTEDQLDGYFYRFVPADAAQPFGAGRFQALARRGELVFDTSTMGPGDVIEVDWVDLPNATPVGDDARPGAGDEPRLRAQALEAGAATVVRGEGCWIDDSNGVVYFTATFGGEMLLGQVFRYIPADRDDPHAGGQLECIARPEDREVMFNPDNLAVAPWGEIFIVEDSLAQCRLLVLNPETGVISTLAENPNNQAELCGVCFAPGRDDVVFMNLQREGITLAVSGPFALDAPADPNLPPPPVGGGVPDAGPDGGAAEGEGSASGGAGCDAGGAASVAAALGTAAIGTLAIASRRRTNEPPEDA